MTQTLAILETLAFGAMFLIALRRHRRRVYLHRLRTDRVFAMNETTRMVVEATEAIRQAGVSFAHLQPSLTAALSAWNQAQASFAPK